MFTKLLSIFRKNTKAPRAKWNRYHQSTFFDNERTSWFFKKRQKKIFKWSILSSLKITFSKHKLLLSFLGFVLSVGIWVFFIFWPLFQIKEIIIEHDSQTININQAYDSVDYIRGKNIFFIDDWDVAERIQKNQNSIKDVVFENRFPDTLVIYLSGHQRAFQVDWYLILENGAIVGQEAPQEDIPTLRVSEDLYERSIFWKTLRATDLESINFLQNELTRNILGFTVKTLYYLPTQRELIIEHQNKNLFIFDLAWNLQSQIEGLTIFHKEWWNIVEKKYVYIDVRIPEKLFLCGFENEFLCRKNMKDIYGDTIFQNFPEDTSLSELSVIISHHYQM